MVFTLAQRPMVRILSVALRRHGPCDGPIPHTRNPAKVQIQKHKSMNGQLERRKRQTTKESKGKVRKTKRQKEGVTIVRTPIYGVTSYTATCALWNSNLNSLRNHRAQQRTNRSPHDWLHGGDENNHITESAKRVSGRVLITSLRQDSYKNS
jgi:hypothetical protein